MPRRKLVKPTLHNQKFDRYIKVKYEQIGKRKVFEMELQLYQKELRIPT